MTSLVGRLSYRPGESPRDLPRGVAGYRDGDIELGRDEYRQVVELARSLEDEITRTYPDSTVSDLRFTVIHFVKQLANEPTLKALELLRDWENRFQLPPETQTLLIPIAGLILPDHLEEETLQFGSVSLRRVDPIEEMLGTDLQELLGTLADEFEAVMTMARAEVSGGDFATRRRRAIEQTQIVLDVLRVRFLTATEPIGKGMSARFVPAREIIGGVFAEESEWKMAMPEDGVNFGIPHFGLLLDERRLVYLQKSYYWVAANEILENKKEIWRRIRLALRWSAKGREADEWDDAFLSQAIALEILLGRGHYDDTVALLLPADSPEMRYSIRSAAGDLRKGRNDIVHRGDGSKLDASRVVSAERLVEKSIHEVIGLAYDGVAAADLDQEIYRRGFEWSI
jgi:hypothetical protein